LQTRVALGPLRQARLIPIASLPVWRRGGRRALWQERGGFAGIYLNVAGSGLLTGLGYGPIALRPSVIFGGGRGGNLPHGEMMTIAMYLAVALFSAYRLDPLAMLVPIAAVLFALGYVMQKGLINPFINRPEHSQFILLVAVALIMVNAL